MHRPVPTLSMLNGGAKLLSWRFVALRRVFTRSTCAIRSPWGLERGQESPSRECCERSLRSKISLRSPFADPGASAKHSGKEVGRVRSFRLRAKSKSRFRIASRYHFEGALRSIQSEYSEALVQNSDSKMHNSKAIQSASFEARENQRTRVKSKLMIS